MGHGQVGRLAAGAGLVFFFKLFSVVKTLLPPPPFFFFFILRTADERKVGTLSLATVVSAVRGVLHEALLPCGSPGRPSARRGQLVCRVRGPAAGDLSLRHRAATACIRREQGKRPLFSCRQISEHGAFSHWQSVCARLGHVLAGAAAAPKARRGRHDNSGRSKGARGRGQTAYSGQHVSERAPCHRARCVVCVCVCVCVHECIQVQLLCVVCCWLLIVRLPLFLNHSQARIKHCSSLLCTCKTKCCPRRWLIT